MRFEQHNCDNPPPRNMVGPKIMFLSKLMRRAMNEAANEQGLFAGQQDIILALVINEGITLGALAKMLEVSTATASVSVKRMEKSGFIEKRPDEKDARIIRLYPTEKAKATPEKLKKHMDDMDKLIKSNMSQQEAEELALLLDKAIENVFKRGDEQC